jgi:hypothetical protein
LRSAGQLGQAYQDSISTHEQHNYHIILAWPATYPQHHSTCGQHFIPGSQISPSQLMTSLYMPTHQCPLSYSFLLLPIVKPIQMVTMQHRAAQLIVLVSAVSWPPQQQPLTPCYDADTPDPHLSAAKGCNRDYHATHTIHYCNGPSHHHSHAVAFTNNLHTSISPLSNTSPLRVHHFFPQH